MIPGVLGRIYIGHIVKMDYYSPLIHYTGAWCRQIEYILVIMTKEGSTKIVNFMIPLSRGSCARLGKGGMKGKVRIMNNNFGNVLIDCFYINRI